MGEFSLDAVLNLPEHKLVSAETAENFDSLDKLSRFRDEFVIPTRREVGAKESDISK
jgi:hypothetical protein